MAASKGAVYFPNLGDCLRGDTVLLSWKLVTSALTDSSTDRLLSDPIYEFLRDPYVLDFVRKPSEIFKKPSAQTKTELDTRTAAINATPAQDGKYDIKVIKEDAVWLSKTVDINEVAALRIVVVEFQTRPQSHLTGPLSTQDVINLQQAVGADGSQASALLASVSAADTQSVDKLWSEFSTEENRHQRLIELYLSERRYSLAFVDSMLDKMLESTQDTTLMGPKAALCQEMLQALFGSADPTEVRNPRREELVITYIAQLPECLALADNGPTEVLENMGLELDWLRTAVTEILHLLASIFQIIDLVDVFLPAEIVSAWFQFVQTYNFLDGLSGMDEQTSELLLPVKSLVSLTSMKMLNLPRSVPFLDGEITDLHPDEDSYITSEDVLKQVDETINLAAEAGLGTAGPVIFTWTLIVQQMLRSHHDRQERRDLQQNRQAQEGFEREVQNIEAYPGVGRRSSAGSIVSMESQSYDKFLNTVYGSTSQQQQDLQRIEQMAIAVTAGGQMHSYLTVMAQTLGEGHTAPFRPYLGARMRSAVLGFLVFSFPVVGYITESISTFFAIVSAGRGYWGITPGTQTIKARQDVIVEAIRDPLAMQQYLGQIWLRWPHEFAPFTNLCKEILSSPASDLLPSLAETSSLTFHLPDPFWEFAEDEADLGRLYLREDVPLFSVLRARKRITFGAEPFCIPADTLGQLASDTARVVQVQYTHSTLALLGKRLEANLAADSYDLALGPLEADDLAEAISLLATAIRSESAKATAAHTFLSGNAAAQVVLEEIGQSLPTNKDIVTVVTDTLDSFVDGDLTDLEAPSFRVITACLQFLDSILHVCPGRVWSYLTRCDLFMSASQAGKLSRITGTLELLDEQFDLLVTVVNFFSNLVESAVASAVHRKVDVKSNGRASDKEPVWQGTSDKALTQVTLSIAHTSVDILENSLTWRFATEIHRSILLGDLIPTLTKLLAYSLGMADDKNANTVLACLEPASQYIIDGFLSPASLSLRFQPLLASTLVALGLPDSTVYKKRAEIIYGRQIAVLDFATVLIRIANSQDKPVTAIEGQLLKCSSLLARLCAADAKYLSPVLSLLGALAERISREDSETPSLLGYLGPQISRSFLQTISRLDKPFNRPKESEDTWAFFSTIMRNGQHWMANCLLTGKTPREALGSDGKLSKLAPDSILKTALTRLRSIRTLPSSETLAILDLLTSAHNYWQWTVFASQEDNGCLDELRAYVRGLQPIAMTAKTDVDQACDQARIAAYIAEAFAMHLYHLRKTGREQDFATDLVNDIDYYLRDGVAVSGYNTSLHINFAKNFAEQFPGFKLDSFSRTPLLPRKLGNGYYYALGLADKMLMFHPAWAGPRGRSGGFRNEMATANLNLSLVDAQVALFHAWEFLLLELSSCMPANEQVITKQMQQVAKQCLECNQTSQGPERIFMRITQSRANLALVILQRLPTASLTPRDTADLLTAVWATTNSIENPLVADQIQHWRIMLRMLYVALRGYRTSPTRPSAGNNNAADDDKIVEVTQCVFNILDQVVAQGFRSWVSLIHDAEGAVLPEDFALITAILQACLCLPGIDEYPSEILNIMVSEDVGQAALALFSWADRLAVKGDPLYGELSILFLLQLSTVPVLAEQLASDGLLAQITSASITTHIQGLDVSPFSDNKGAQRCYDIWAKGILPLLLNVLSAPGLGPNIATEVAYVLNQFPNLLKSSADRIEPPGISRTTVRGAHYITLVGVSELNSLAFLTRGLSMYRDNYNREIPDVSWDAATALEGVDYWLSTRKMLRERMLPLGQREADWRAMKTGIEGVSVLEEKIVSLLEAVKEVLSEEQD